MAGTDSSASRRHGPPRIMNGQLEAYPLTDLLQFLQSMRKRVASQGGHDEILKPKALREQGDDDDGSSPKKKKAPKVYGKCDPRQRPECGLNSDCNDAESCTEDACAGIPLDRDL